MCDLFVEADHRSHKQDGCPILAISVQRGWRRLGKRDMFSAETGVSNPGAACAFQWGQSPAYGLCPIKGPTCNIPGLQRLAAARCGEGAFP